MRDRRGFRSGGRGGEEEDAGGMTAREVSVVSVEGVERSSFAMVVVLRLGDVAECPWSIWQIDPGSMEMHLAI